MTAVITVVGTDKVGILAKVANICADAGANIEEVTQTILRGTFAMIMMVSLPENKVSFDELAAHLKKGGEEIGVDINVTRQDLYDAMHRV